MEWCWLYLAPTFGTFCFFRLDDIGDDSNRYGWRHSLVLALLWPLVLFALVGYVVGWILKLKNFD